MSVLSAQKFIQTLVIDFKGNCTGRVLMLKSYSWITQFYTYIYRFLVFNLIVISIFLQNTKGWSELMVPIFQRKRDRHLVGGSQQSRYQGKRPLYWTEEAIWWYHKDDILVEKVRDDFKTNRWVIGSSILFRPVSIVLNNDNRPEPDGTAGQSALGFWSHPKVSMCSIYDDIWGCSH